MAEALKSLDSGQNPLDNWKDKKGKKLRYENGVPYSEDGEPLKMPDESLSEFIDSLPLDHFTGDDPVARAFRIVNDHFGDDNPDNVLRLKVQYDLTPMVLLGMLLSQCGHELYSD